MEDGDVTMMEGEGEVEEGDVRGGGGGADGGGAGGVDERGRPAAGGRPRRRDSRARRRRRSSARPQPALAPHLRDLVCAHQELLEGQLSPLRAIDGLPDLGQGGHVQA